MASELGVLNPKSNSQRQQQRREEDELDGSTKENRPLPKPCESSPTGKQQRSISAVNIEELEKKFAPFVRADVYGTMGRGKLSWTQKVLLGIAFLTLLPIRVAVALAILAIYYLICRICTMFLVPNREGITLTSAGGGGPLSCIPEGSFRGSCFSF